MGILLQYECVLFKIDLLKLTFSIEVLYDSSNAE